MTPKRLIGLGGAMYLLAWLVPVVKDGTTLAQGGVPGWEALRFALAPVWPVLGIRGDSVFGSILSTLSGLTNVLVPLALVQLARPARAGVRRLGWALLGAAVVNASWLLVGPEGLRLGYYLWLASFVVLAVAAFRIARARVTPAQTLATA